MKAIRIRLAALVLAVLLLCGCGNVQQKLDFLRKDYTAYSDMEYSRPDIEQMDELLQNVIEVSKGDDLQAILERIYAFNDFYDQFQTSYALADIRYCGDLTDLYWEEEYEFCMEASAAVDAGLESPFAEGRVARIRSTLEEALQ